MIDGRFIYKRFTFDARIKKVTKAKQSIKLKNIDDPKFRKVLSEYSYCNRAVIYMYCINKDIFYQ